MAAKDNYIFGKDGNFYRRIPGGKCADCELPHDYCHCVKCLQKGVKYHWIKDEEMFKQFLSQLTPEDFQKLVTDKFGV